MAFAGVAADHPPRSDSHIVVRNTAVQMLRYTAVWGANVTLVLFLPRYLGDQGLGQLQFAVSFVSLFAFLVALGTRNYMIKEVARDSARLPQMLRTALGLRVMSAGVVIVIMGIVAEMYGTTGSARHVIYLAMAWMVITSFAQLLAAGLHGLERMGWASFAEITNKVLVVAIGVTLLVQGGGVRTYVAVLVLGAIVNVLINAGYIVRFARLRLDFDIQRMRVLAVRGGPYILMGFLLGAYMHTDVVMLQAFTSDSVVGWHAAALQIYRSVEFLPAVLTTALLPTLARIHSLSGAEAVGPLARRSLAAMAIVMAPIGVGLSITSAELIAAFPYPPEFENTVPILVLMALSTPISALLTILGTIAMATDRQRIWAYALALTVLLNVALNAIVIPYAQNAYGNGATGAAATTLLTEFLLMVFGIALLRRVIFERRLMISFAKVIVAVSLMGVVVYDAKMFGLGLWALVGAGAFTYALLVLFLRVVDRSDVAVIWQSVTHRSQRQQ